MKILLHIGTEKTGSSYAQMLLARNRAQLKQNGIYFPSAGKREKDMLAGRISPGNGKELFLALEKGHQSKLLSLLDTYRKDAQKHQCSSILLSNENLVESFSDDKKVSIFLEACKRVDIDKPNLLLVVRDPVSQALSLFKHRAKNGNVASVEEWLTTRYKLHEHLGHLFNVLTAHNISITVRKYRKDSESVQHIFFKDWLALPSPQVCPNVAVNPSLTIPELYIIRQLKLKNPSLIKEFYDRMLAIPFKLKSEDKQLIKYHKRLINNHLADFGEVWNQCNKYLAADEQLVLPEKLGVDSVKDIPDYSFSQAQMNEISNIIAEGPSMKLRLRVMGRRVKTSLGRLRRKFV